MTAGDGDQGGNQPAGSAGAPRRGMPLGPKQGEEQSPGIDFSTFVLSLSTSALYNLGLVEEPETGERAEPDLHAARQTISILEMLQEKTRSNLEPDEARLLESLLFELRMRYVEATK